MRGGSAMIAEFDDGRRVVCLYHNDGTFQVRARRPHKKSHSLRMTREAWAAAFNLMVKLFNKRNEAK